MTTVRAQDMTSREYTGLITKIHNTGRKLDQLIGQGIAYCAFHHVAHGNKAPWDSLLDAAPQFARKIIRDARKACESADKGELDTVLPEVESAAVSQLEERRQNGRKPKAQDDTAPSKPDSFELSRTVNGDTEKLSVTSDEFQAAMAAVEALRKQASDLADRAAKVEQLQAGKKTGTNG